MQEKLLQIREHTCPTASPLYAVVDTGGGSSSRDGAA